MNQTGHMFHIVLFQPEIPPNTGNIIRLCANTGTQLHLIEPLGFSLDHKQLRRAGLDYHEFVGINTHPDFEAFCEAVKPARVLAFSTKGERNYSEISYLKGDALLFGPETRGLPAAIRDSLPRDQVLRLPMFPGNRSLNLANTAAAVVYEAWRQHGFAGGE